MIEEKSKKNKLRTRLGGERCIMRKNYGREMDNKQMKRCWEEVKKKEEKRINYRRNKEKIFIKREGCRWSCSRGVKKRRGEGRGIREVR